MAAPAGHDRRHPALAAKVVAGLNAHLGGVQRIFLGSVIDDAVTAEMALLLVAPDPHRGTRDSSAAS